MVLIVDDLVPNARVLARLLSRAGFDADVVGSGREALGYIDEKQPDLVLLDVMMPEMDGLETLRALRADPHPQKKNIPVLMYSADGSPDRIAESERLGAQGYIVKGSTTWPQLEEQIKRALDQTC